MRLFSSFSAAACIFEISMAQLLRYSPPEQSALSYTFVAAHPDITGSESDIFIQIQGPASMSWVALGQGGSMKGSQMFIIYTNTLGTNITLSPRLSGGHSQPSAEIWSNISLLAGSAVANGNMTANILCQKCNTWSGGSMDLSGSNQPWIWAYKSGDPIRSNSTSVHIQQHDDGAYAGFTLNMNSLSTSNSSNPFLDPMNAQDTETGDSSAGYNGIAIPIHGVIMCFVFTIGFPLGAFLIRLASFQNLVWIHAAIQILSYLAAIIGLGVGVFIANQGAADLSSTHPVLGIVIVVLLVIQPILGYVHHLQYKRYQTSSPYTHAHVWFGRVIVTVGIIDGLLGLLLAGQSSGFIIAYCVVVGAIWVLWITFVVSAVKREKVAKVQKNNIRMASLVDERNRRHGRGMYS